MQDATSVRVLIVDDHRTFSAALAGALARKPGFQVVGTLTSSKGLETAVQRLSPDVVLLDIEIDERDGIEAAHALSRLESAPKVVMVTAHDDPDRAIDAFRAGAAGFVSKTCSLDELQQAIQNAVSGGSWMPSHLLSDVLNRLAADQHRMRTDRERLERLTPRERELLAYMMEGLDRHKIAAAMAISPNTVRTHVHNILAKLEVNSSLEAVVLAHRANFAPSAAED